MTKIAVWLSRWLVTTWVLFSATILTVLALVRAVS